MIFKDKSFILRHFTASDAQGYFECQNDPEARRGFMTTPKTLAEAKKEVGKIVREYKKKKPSNEHLAIEIEGKFVGYISIDMENSVDYVTILSNSPDRELETEYRLITLILCNLNQKFFEHRAGIGFCMHPLYRRRGITTKAVILVTKYAFKKYSLKRITGWCRTFNKASARVLEKAGYRLEGILRKNKFKNRRYLDDMVWAQIK